MQEYLVQPLQLNGAYFSVPLDELPRVARPIFKAKSASQSSKGKRVVTRKPGLMGVLWSGVVRVHKIFRMA